MSSTKLTATLGVIAALAFAPYLAAEPAAARNEVSIETLELRGGLPAEPRLRSAWSLPEVDDEVLLARAPGRA
jgi:hypothetical protein